MPITEAKFKCNICEDIFDATSDEYVSCKCGESTVKPSQYSTDYKGKINFERLDCNTYYFVDDFLILKDGLKEKYSIIKDMSSKLGFFVHEITEIGKSGEKFLSVISISKTESASKYSSEYNEVSFYYRLNKEYSNPSEINLNERFNIFIEFLYMVENGEILLKDRKRLLDYSDEKDIYWSREQVKEYDYNFRF